MRYGTSDYMTKWSRKVPVHPKDECWPWDGAINSCGYGSFRVKDGKAWTSCGAHRVGYEYFRGKVPEGLELDHLCRRRDCVNPWHLEAVEKRVNILRGDGAGAKAARKTHCKYGHPLSGDNLVVAKNRKERICFECRWARNRGRKPS